MVSLIPSIGISLTANKRSGKYLPVNLEGKHDALFHPAFGIPDAGDFFENLRILHLPSRRVLCRFGGIVEIVVGEIKGVADCPVILHMKFLFSGKNCICPLPGPPAFLGNKRLCNAVVFQVRANHQINGQALTSFMRRADFLRCASSGQGG